MNIPFRRNGADLPLAVRIKRAAFAMTMLMVVTLGSVLLTLALIEIPANQIETNQNAVNVIGEVLSGDIRNQLGNLRHLSRSSLVWTALTDSAGREAYLKPFLQNREKEADLMQMQLLDYRGRRVLGDLPAFVATGQSAQLVTKVLKRRQPVLALVAKDGRSALLAIFPVAIPSTQETIGALAGVIDLSDLLQKRSAGLGQKLGVDLMHQGRAIDARPSLPASRFFPANFDLALGESTEGGALALRLYSTENPWLQPVFERIFLSALIAALLGILLWQMSGVIARQLTQRFDRLAKACVAISEGRAATIPEDAANDEIGVLSRTLRQALNSYEQVHAHLEKLVEERTKELSESEEQYRMLVASMAEGVTLQDANSAILAFNQSAERILGLTADQLKGRTSYDPGWRSIHEDGSPFPGETHPVVLTLKTGSPQSNVIMGIRKPDGTLTWISINTQPIVEPGKTTPSRVVASFRDITEQKRTEQELSLLSFAMNQVHEAAFVIDEHARFRYVNDDACRALEYSREELLGLSVADLDPDFPLERWPGHWLELRGRKTLRFEGRHRRKSGSIFPVEIAANYFEFEGRGYNLALVRDITERKHLEQELLESEQRLRLHVEQTPLAVIEWDTDFRVLQWNRAAERIFGYTAAEAMGRHASFIVAGEAKAAVDEVWTRLLSGRGGERSTNENLTKDGRAIMCEWYNTPLRMSGGKVIGVASLVEDVTVRRQAEAVRTQLAAIVQSSHDAIVGKDLDGIITSWNPGAETVYGYRAEEVVGKPVSMLAPEGRKDEITRLLERVRRGEAVMNFETERYRKDGRRIDISLDISPISDASGCITGASTIARDVTEKKQAERALKKLNRALKALSSCNEALIHAGDEKQLLDRICRLIIEIEGYRMAWVGYVEHDENKTVTPVAQGGYEAGYLEHAAITWADNERGRGPLGLAIRSGQIQVVQDVNTDPRFEPWRANAARLGYGAVLVAPLLSDSKVLGALSIYAESINAFDAAEIALLGELAADMAFGIVTLRTRSAQEQGAARLQHSMEATIQAIAGTVEMRDPYTAGHQRRVAELATAIAQAMGLTQDQVRGVHLAGVVHDLGKIHIPAEILSKPGKLTRIEFELIKAHPEAGYEILKGVDFPWPIAQIVYQHHERLDGSGYPRGLKADEILPAARIIAVADVVEAMSSHRPYRPSLGLEPALQEISANAGKYYDADAARVCVALFRERGFAFKG